MAIDSAGPCAQFEDPRHVSKMEPTTLCDRVYSGVGRVNWLGFLRGESTMRLRTT